MTTLPVILKNISESDYRKCSQSSKCRLSSRRNAYLLRRNYFGIRTNIFLFEETSIFSNPSIIFGHRTLPKSHFLKLASRVFIDIGPRTLPGRPWAGRPPKAGRPPFSRRSAVRRPPPNRPPAAAGRPPAALYKQKLPINRTNVRRSGISLYPGYLIHTICGFGENK